MGAAFDVFERWCFSFGQYYDLLKILFLEFPNAWELERALNDNDDNNETKGDEPDPDLDSDGEECDTEDTNTKAKKLPPARAQSSLRPLCAYEEFLRFLESGCAGSPLQGYPAVIVVVSTIPSSVCFHFFFVGWWVLM